ncbi:hypothetical protein APS56_12325 [Pseudalgibacter alginicilyticus]|uniref:DUF4271 domain-containing protein n=1 Tax=Pseudalgibacter alginicilyticus TaxID=1736674 RepID=A0A0P0CI58_9FLAO|nr:DUF4271 domain-containing protein [Pseudalgibacter alginicilyticus]ALJ05867.1 hypothetical protein APS56_12325 [Pseudalgibacter alginicilyticus]
MLRHVTSNELFTILMVIGLVFIGVTKLLFPKRFDEFMSILGNSNYLKIHVRDQKFLDKFDALLFINLVLSIATFCFIIYRQLTDYETPNINIVFKYIIGIAVIILIKVLFERLIGSLFEIDKLIDQYLFQKITYKNFIGVLLIPINAFLIFSIHPTLTHIYIVVIFLLIINLIGIITSFKEHQNLIKSNLFYFILYLCTLEISPYIILYKVFNP